MRESVGTSWIMGLAVVFILIFSAYLTIILNYSKTFRVKNTVVSIIEKYEGFKSGNGNSMGIVNNYLLSSGYKQTGICPDGYYGATTLAGNNVDSEYEFISGSSNKKYFYCIKKVSVYNSTLADKPQKYYYRVILFTNNDLPVLGNVFTFTAQGRTIDLDNSYDTLFKIQY